MEKIQRKVGGIMDSAESSLSNLIQTALRHKKYDDVAFVAEALNQVAKIRQGLQVPGLLHNPTVRDASRLKIESDADIVETASSSLNQPKARANERGGLKRGTYTKYSKYPLFFRDDNRLIKVGWSKKNQDEYAHRVPKDVVLAFAEHLHRSVDAGALFEMESLFPVPTKSGKQVPSYQIYVVAAWLRGADVIKKKGRDGYVITEKSKLREGFNELWETLRTRTT